MSILHTLKKGQVDVVGHLKEVLDQLAQDIHQDPFPPLFPRIFPPPFSRIPRKTKSLFHFSRHDVGM
jgi:hypothetical protein